MQSDGDREKKQLGFIGVLLLIDIVKVGDAWDWGRRRP